MWYKLPVSDRMSLMKTYKKGGFSYNDMVKDYNDSYQKFGEGGTFNTGSGPVSIEPTPNVRQPISEPNYNYNDNYNAYISQYTGGTMFGVNAKFGNVNVGAKVFRTKGFTDNYSGDRYKPQYFPQVNVGYVKKFQDGGTSDDSSFLEKTLNMLDYPQKQMMKQLTGKEQSPSEYLKEKGYNNKWVGLAADIVVDPMNFLPIAKLKYLKVLSGAKDLDKINTIKKQYNTAVKTSAYIDNGQDALKVVYEPAKVAVKPKIAEPYLLRSTRKMTKEEEIMDSFLSHETSNKNKLKRTTNYSNPNLQNKK